MLAHELRGDPTPFTSTWALLTELLACVDARVLAVRLLDRPDHDDAAEISVETPRGERIVRAAIPEAALVAARAQVPFSVPASMVIRDRRAKDNVAVLRPVRGA